MEKKKMVPKVVQKRESLPGISQDTAVIVNNIASEYDYIAKLLGKPGSGWTLERQALRQADGKSYDLIDVVLKDGTRRRYWFDITSFFGKT
jgi:hypothetical protein